ncbi:serine hydrolase [Microbacterium telephonicum]|uniref:serine hydrolase n=1 Tax=Microbacterium telephonicum TaxID=1714841 RepID=UPI000EABACE2|nr:serine hydrolase [Microbacterium telephonicum]
MLPRVTDRPLDDHLRDDLFTPLGMGDTGYGTPASAAHRLPAAYRHDEAGLVEVEPAGGGFWDGMGWGYGLGVQTTGDRAGRVGWSGGLGTDYFVDPDGTIGILLTQVEMGPALMPLLRELQELV